MNGAATVPHGSAGSHGPQGTPHRLITIGLMSGTSLDGMDAVAARWPSPSDGPEILARAHCDFPDALRAELLALNTSGANELHRAALAANALSVTAAQAVAQVLAQLHAHQGLHPGDVAAIGFHGQTVRHRPGEFDGHGYTLQLHNASLLAELTGLDVVCDFRSRDVAAGGQGAPLVPAFHAGVFAQAGVDVAVLNLGGIANLTLLHGFPPGRQEPQNVLQPGSRGLPRVLGLDCGPANVLMDLWASRHLGRPLDEGGRWAATGHVIEPLLSAMQREPFFARPAPKSTGRDLFNSEWLDAFDLRRHNPADVQATLCELTAWAVHDHLMRDMPQVHRLLVCGGGAANMELMRRLQQRVGPGVAVQPTDEAGLQAQDVEAAAFSWLAWKFICREPGNLVQVTGARGPRVLGALYPAGRG